MERTFGTVSAIKYLGYPGSACVRRCDCDELPCPLLTWLCGQMHLQCPEIKGGGGDLLLAEELNNMLQEMSCPLTFEVLDPAALHTITNYCISELQAAVINKHKNVTSDAKTETSPKEQRSICSDREETCEEHDHYEAEWESVLDALNMDASSRITDVLNEVQWRSTHLPCDALRPLLSTSLSPEQWVKLDKLNDILSKDYKCRKQMMTKRFQVTLESFAWGDNKMHQRKVLDAVLQIASLDARSCVSVPLLLAARLNQSCNEPIRPGNTTLIYKVKMGPVPDRGGRPGEMEPPMPPWEDRKSGHRSGRGGGDHKGQKFANRKKKKH